MDSKEQKPGFIRADGVDAQIFDEWNPSSQGMADHINFIHQSLLDLAIGLEEIRAANSKQKRQSLAPEWQKSVDERLERAAELQKSVDERLERVANSQKTIEDAVLRDRSSEFEGGSPPIEDMKGQLECIKSCIFRLGECLMKESENTDLRLQRMEENLRMNSEEIKVEMISAFEKEARLCRSSYISENLNNLRFREKGRYPGRQKI